MAKMYKVKQYKNTEPYRQNTCRLTPQGLQNRRTSRKKCIRITMMIEGKTVLSTYL